VGSREEFAERLTSLRESRARLPELVRNRFISRHRRSVSGHSGRLLLVDVAGPATGVVGTQADPRSLHDRAELLWRLVLALRVPGVDGVIATADVLEDLLLLEVLDDRLAIGSVTPGGPTPPANALSTSLTGYDPETIGVIRLDGGRVGMSIDPSDPASVARLEECARAVTDLASRSVMVVLEPSWSGTPAKGSAAGSAVASQARAVGIASAIGGRSSYSWLALGASADFSELAAATTLPVLVRAGEPSDKGDVELWESNLATPGVRGMVVPSALLFAPEDDSTGMLGVAARLVHGS